MTYFNKTVKSKHNAINERDDCTTVCLFDYTNFKEN